MNQGTIQGQCNAGCLLFMSAACSDRQQSDASEATLYTQLAASKKHSRFDAPQSWMQTWFAALNRFGWVMNGHESRSLPAIDLGSGTLWDWTRRHLPAFFPNQLVCEAEHLTKETVAAYPDQAALAMLTPHVIEANPVPPDDQVLLPPEHKLGLQLAFYEPTSGLHLVAISMKTRQPLSSGFLIEVLDPDAVIGNIEVTYYSVQMMELIYATFRARISQALEAHRPSQVCALEEVGDVQSK